MADDKRGREKQARDGDRRQRERAITAELERGDEPEPTAEPVDPVGLKTELEAMEFPATGAAVVGAVGDAVVESAGRELEVADLVPAVETEHFESPAAVQGWVQRPTVAASMKRVLEASEGLPTSVDASQRRAYEKTFLALRGLDADDEDEGLAEMTDWIVGRITERGSLPGSRAVRRQAAKVCRANGYAIRNDEWLGV